MTGNRLYEWQQSWRRLLKESVVYFEENSRRHEHENSHASAAFRGLGASIANFFSDSVTIIVSQRPYNKRGEYPQGDIFQIARKKELKVWNYEKVFRFMGNLGEPVPGDEPSSKLSSLLRNEKIFGPNDRDPNARRDDVKYFSNLYIYAYDLKQQTRPVAVREWGKTADYPKLCKSTNGRSLFVEDAHPHTGSSAVKRHARRMLFLEETKEYRQKLIEASYSDSDEKCPSYEARVHHKALWQENQTPDMGPTDINEKQDTNRAQEKSRMESHRHLVAEKHDDSPVLLPQHEDESREQTSVKVDHDHSSRKLGTRKPPRVLRRENSTMGFSGSKFKNDYGEIQASGVQNQSGSAAVSGTNIGNGLAPSYSLVYNKKIAKDQKKTMVFDQSAASARSRGNRIVEVAKENDDLQGDITNVSPAKKVLKRTALQEVVVDNNRDIELDTVKESPKALEEESTRDSPEVVQKNLKRKREHRVEIRQKRAKYESKPGYCENCRVKYNDFEDHIMTDKHRQFATNSENFADIDRLINTVEVTRSMGL
ncbi:DEKNAAC104608 [Brettanomyces naardenensis]|uniref:DEKNAAC104608 n=1 Tax=Brettanomyces naardenensis TaxID=13370 RepID=A0A448YR25_BRENA|nr:DEKNAAC104608 [Brettanomyces naardenensis]